MIKIEHIAIWVKDLERMKEFYVKWFDFQSNEKYTNPKKGFSSYFLSQGQENCRLELMTRETELFTASQHDLYGWAHIALSLGSKEKVDSLTKQMEEAGINCVGQPRWTGDGYYESVIEDPEGNKIELTV
jgi:lactoylglutathione lyase